MSFWNCNEYIAFNELFNENWIIEWILVSSNDVVKQQKNIPIHQNEKKVWKFVKQNKIQWKQPVISAAITQ